MQRATKKCFLLLSAYMLCAQILSLIVLNPMTFVIEKHIYIIYIILPLQNRHTRPR